MKKINPIACKATDNKDVYIPDKNGSNVVLYFYPKDLTPGCTKESNDFKEYYSNFTKLNTIIYGVSKDSLASHEKFKSKYNFPFELISDSDEKLCKIFDVIKPKKFMGREYIGIVRSTFVIDNEGNIIKSWENVKVNGHIKEVLNFIETL